MLTKSLLALALLAGVVGAAFAQGPYDEFPRGGPGMWGHRMYLPGDEFPRVGPGMWGHRMPSAEGMMGMMGMDMMCASPGELAIDPAIPQEKRDQIRDLNLSLMQSLTTKSAELQNLRIAMMKAVHAYPIDQGAVKSSREGIQRVMGEVMAMRAETLAKVQQILGKELWEHAHPEWYGPRMGREGMMPSR